MNTISAPGVVWGNYPERRENDPLGTWRLGTAAYRKQVTEVGKYLAFWQNLSEANFAARLVNLRGRLARDGLNSARIAETLAVVGEAIRRTQNIEVYDCQYFAAAVILDNRLAEMATGEGKTLAALLAAASGALAGIPVHVLTANDYLVARDAERLAPVCALLGLSVGAVTHDMQEKDRRLAYSRSITYVTAKELVFDYLRDGLRLGTRRSDLARRAHALESKTEPPLLRGLCMAVIDEADSLLIDEAQMPLILSRQENDAASRGFHWQAMMLAERLSANIDFEQETEHSRPLLTEAGRHRLAALAAPLGGRWQSWRLREDAVGMALAARHQYRRNHHYLIRDGKVEIIDEVTGRAAPGRIWARGLHTMIEIKEGCKPSPSTRTLAQITYQRFFPRYLRIGGMSGTLQEARGELREIYRLPVVSVPLRTPSARKMLPTRLFASRSQLWAAVTERIRELQASGRPVLVGTGSVAESETLSACLDRAGIEHQVLNARFDQEEAMLVARAGQAGQVTVTTNMAGRGTDIPLGPGVNEAGGLHVLCCQHNASRRIDRQLQGRCARQGDAGSSETWLAVDEESGPTFIRLLKSTNQGHYGETMLPTWLLRAGLYWHQAQRSASQRRVRRQLLQADREWEQGLSFRGRGE